MRGRYARTSPPFGERVQDHASLGGQPSPQQPAARARQTRRSYAHARRSDEGDEPVELEDAPCPHFFPLIYSGEVRHRAASNPVAKRRSRSATSNPACP